MFIKLKNVYQIMKICHNNLPGFIRTCILKIYNRAKNCSQYKTKPHQFLSLSYLIVFNEFLKLFDGNKTNNTEIMMNKTCWLC